MYRPCGLLFAFLYTDSNLPFRFCAQAELYMFALLYTHSDASGFFSAHSDRDTLLCYLQTEPFMFALLSTDGVIHVIFAMLSKG